MTRHAHITSLLLAGLVVACSGTEPGGDEVLRSSIASHDFGSLPIGGQSPELTVTFSNVGESISIPLTISLTGTGAADFTITSTECNNRTLAPSESCALRIRFKPSSAGVREGTLRAEGNDVVVPVLLRGTGGGSALQVPVGGLAFGDVRVGAESPTRSLVVRNNSTVRTGPLTVALGGTHAGDFRIERDFCSGVQLAAGIQCVIDVRFRPSLDGTQTASLLISGDPGGSVSAPLSGVGGVPTVLSVTPTSPVLAAVRVGTAGEPELFTVSNTGSSESGEILVAVTGSDRTDFELVGNQCSAQRLTPGAVCSFSIRFRPAQMGERTAQVEIRSGFADTRIVPLSATGTAVMLTSTPSDLNFPATLVGTASAPLDLVVKNVGNVASLPLETEIVDLCYWYYYYQCYEVPYFQISANACAGVALEPGASCTVSIRYLPDFPVSHIAQFAVGENLDAGTATQLTNLRGQGAGLSGSTNFIDFGPIPAGETSATQPVTITNNATTGTGPITAPSSGGAFQVTSNGCAGVSLAPGASCTMVLRFAPPSVGNYSFEFSVSAVQG
ncbi:MAG TPA: choice-of-anchor D domain-containing protein, partial [Gemmatimonadales bacterium]